MDPTTKFTAHWSSFGFTLGATVASSHRTTVASAAVPPVFAAEQISFFDSVISAVKSAFCFADSSTVRISHCKTKRASYWYSFISALSAADEESNSATERSTKSTANAQTIE
jgi:hypothetical protein